MGNIKSVSRKSNDTDSGRSSIDRLDEPSNNLPQLMIQTKTWNKNSFGLFDYESRDIQKKSLRIQGTCKLMRSEVIKDAIDIEAINEPFSSPDFTGNSVESQLARLYYKNGGYWIYHKNQMDVAHIYSNPEEKLWYVVKHYQNKNNTKGYRLQKNDIVKFGRVRLRVRDIDNAEKEAIPTSNPVNRLSGAQRKMTQDEIGVSIDVNDIELQQINRNEQESQFERARKDIIIGKKEEGQKVNITSGSSGGPTCRICWGAEEDLEKDFNPLISPCNCTGTINSIHLKCLKEWLETKRTMKVHRRQVMIKFKKLDCEICKQMFPFQIAHNNKIVDIVEIERPESNFIIFESLNNSAQKLFYIINTEEKSMVKVGRGQDSDVRITDDISVSRCHATIKKTSKGEYILEDFNSKFGTLIQVQYPVFLSSLLYNNQPIVFQSGKTCLSIQVRQQTSCLSSCCLRPNINEQRNNLVSIDQKNLFPKQFLKNVGESESNSPNKKAKDKGKDRKTIARAIIEDDGNIQEDQHIEQVHDVEGGDHADQDIASARHLESENRSMQMQNYNSRISPSQAKFNSRIPSGANNDIILDYQQEQQDAQIYPEEQENSKLQNMSRIEINHLIRQITQPNKILADDSVLPEDDSSHRSKIASEKSQVIQAERNQREPVEEMKEEENQVRGPKKTKSSDRKLESQEQLILRSQMSDAKKEITIE